MPGDDPPGQDHKGNDGDCRKWQNCQHAQINGGGGHINRPQYIPGKDKKQDGQQEYAGELMPAEKVSELIIEVINRVHIVCN